MAILHHLPIFTWFGAATSHFLLQNNHLNREKSGHFFTQKPRSNQRGQKPKPQREEREHTSPPVDGIHVQGTSHRHSRSVLRPRD